MSGKGRLVVDLKAVPDTYERLVIYKNDAFVNKASINTKKL